MNSSLAAKPSGATSGVHVWLVLWRATRSVQAHAKRNVREQGLGLSDFGVLEALLNKGPLPVNALGTKILLTSGSITAAVDRLEHKGLVERRGHPKDRRARIVHLTKAGREVIGQVFSRHAAAMERAVSALSQRERSALLKLLRKLGRGADECFLMSDSTQRKRVRHFGDKTK